MNVTLKELQAQLPGYTYNYLWRSLNALQNQGIIHPWPGPAREWRLTLDDARRLKRFLRIVKSGKHFKIAVLELALEEKEREIERLHALVPVKQPWRTRLIRWIRRLFTTSP